MMTDEDVAAVAREVKAALREGAADNGQPAEVILPSGPTTNDESCRMAMEALARRRDIFRRGRVPSIMLDDGAVPLLPETVRSMIDKVATVWRWNKDKAGRDVKVPKEHASMDHARLWLGSLHVAELRELSVISKCPVLIAKGDRAEVLRAGYYAEHGGIYVASRGDVADLSLEDAKGRLLDELLGDFRFKTDADRSRAVAAILAPAMILGMTARSRVPAMLFEAEEEQTGKGYLARLIRVIYGQGDTVAVAKTCGGVGSFDEAVQQRLTRALLFVFVDNLRGNINSEILESCLTESSVSCRAPHKASVDVDPRRFAWQLTSNGVKLTRDFAARCCAVRLVKRHGHAWRKFGLLDLEEHVSANQPYFLGAVFAVLRAWIEAGRPGTSDLRANNSFRPWWQSVDWICTELLGLVSPIDGHLQVQERLGSKERTWFREVVAKCYKRQEPGQEWTATGFLEITEAEGIAAPWSEGKASAAAVGRALTPIFQNHDGPQDVDGFVVTRTTKMEARPDGHGTKEQKFYVIEKA